MKAWAARPLAWAALGLALGIQTGFWVGLPLWAGLLGLLLALLALGRCLWTGREAWLGLCLGCLGLFLGLIRVQPLARASSSPLWPDESAIRLQASVLSDEGPRPLTFRHVFIVQEVQIQALDPAGSALRSWSGKVRVSLDEQAADDLGLLPGDRLRCYGSLRDVEGPTNPGEFDYRAYLLGRGIHGQFSARQGWPTQRLAEGAWWGPRRLAARAGHWMERGLEAGLKDRALVLGKGIVLGDKSGLSREDLADYSRSGLADLLAVSGTHFTLALGLFLALARLFTVSKRKQAAAGLLLGLTYALMTGFEAPVQRAFALFALWLLGRLFDLDTDLPTSLAAGAIAILCAQPGALWEAGFQLSFCTTLAVCTLGPTFSQGMPKAWPAWLRGALGAMLGAQWALLPLLAYQFHQFCWPALFSSLVSGAFTFLVLALGLPLGLLGAWVPGAAQLLGWPLTWVLKALDSFSNFSAQLPGSAYSSGLLHPLGCLAFAAWALAACFARGRLKRPLLALLALFLLGSLFWQGLPWRHRHPGLTKLWCLDIGQGDSELLEFEDGRTLLMDAGPAMPDAGSWVVVPAMRALGIQQLTWAAGSHADADHIGGLAWVLRQFPVKELLWNGQDVHPQPWDAVLDAAKERKVPMRALGREVARTPADGPWKVLAPFPPRSSRRKPKRPDTNAASLVMDVEGWLLLTGDLPQKVEKRLVAQGLPPVQALKVGHHGSRGSSSAASVRALKPQVALISCGRRNYYGHPNAVALKALEGIPLWRTDLQGCLSLERRADGSLSVKPWRTATEEALRQPRLKPRSAWHSLQDQQSQAWVGLHSDDDEGSPEEP